MYYKQESDEWVGHFNIGAMSFLQARPAMTAELLSLFNHSEIFVVLGRNLTDSGVFTEVEISTLEKVLNETKVYGSF